MQQLRYFGHPGQQPALQKSRLEILHSNFKLPNQIKYIQLSLFTHTKQKQKNTETQTKYN